MLSTTLTSSSAEIRVKSTWTTLVPQVSHWSSRIKADSLTAPVRSTRRLPWRKAVSSLSPEIDRATGSKPWPYKTAGISPPAETAGLVFSPGFPGSDFKLFGHAGPQFGP